MIKRALQKTTCLIQKIQYNLRQIHLKRIALFIQASCFISDTDLV